MGGVTNMKFFSDPEKKVSGPGIFIELVMIKDPMLSLLKLRMEMCTEDLLQDRGILKISINGFPKKKIGFLVSRKKQSFSLINLKVMPCIVIQVTDLLLVEDMIYML